MKIIQRVSALATILSLSLLAWSLPCYSATSPKQLVYVQDGHNLITYSVSRTTAAATKLGSLPLDASPSYPIQIFHAPTAPFLYILGFTSATQEYFWVYATTPGGVPNAGTIQKLSVKPALGQFFIQPKGRFAYAMYSWDFGFKSDIVLYTVSSKTGQLTNTRKVLENFTTIPENQTVIYGLSRGGSKLFTEGYNTQGHGGDSYNFDYYSIDATTGLLGKDVPFFYFGISGQGDFGDGIVNNQVIALAYNDGFGNAKIDVYPFAVNRNPAPIVNCTSAMAPVCGDNLSFPLPSLPVTTPLQFDPAGNFLFITDTSIHSIVIANIDLKKKVIKETGSFIPGNPLVSFSTDGKLVCAVDKKSVGLYIFDSSSGLITTHSSVNLPSDVGGILLFSQP
jgi:hypothetical protein